MQEVAEVTADLNFRGIGHGDTQLKNFWIKPDHSIEAFDWESSAIFPDHPDASLIAEIGSDDLKTLMLVNL